MTTVAPVRTGQAPKRTVGFVQADTSPSSVLRGGNESPASATGRPADDLASPSALAAALKKERSLPNLQLPGLPRLKLGAKKGLGRSKSSADLRGGAKAVAVPPDKPRSATSSPQAASSNGSEHVSIPFE